MLTIEEAASMLHSVFPMGNFHFEVSAWVHGEKWISHTENIADRIDVKISVWSADLKKRFHGNTLEEAVGACREAVLRHVEDNVEAENQKQARLSQFNTAATVRH